MIQKHTFVLIHSPLVGPLTWSRVAAEMRIRGQNVLVPTLEDSPESRDPFWKQHAELVWLHFASRKLWDLKERFLQLIFQKE